MITPFDDLLPKLPKKVALAARECWEACKGSKIGDTITHIHHSYWLEPLTEPVENRIRYILLHKASKERMERLRCLRPFDISKATPECKKMLAAFKKAWTVYYEKLAAYNKVFDTEDTAVLGKAQGAYYKVWAALDKALEVRDKVSSSPQMLAVHAQACGCPWSKNKDIFGNFRVNF